jgi:hypothetical protein
MLVQFDKDYVAQSASQPWGTWYAEQLVAHFASA